jgi:hypothetical protein
MDTNRSVNQESQRPPFPAESEEEWRELMAAGEEIAFIRTAEDWQRLLKESRGTDQDLLAGCDDDIVEAFTHGLVFNAGGLAGADYSPIARTLSFGAFRALFERFGIGLGLFADYDGYKCDSPGTCIKMHERICTSNC